MPRRLNILCVGLPDEAAVTLLELLRGDGFEVSSQHADDARGASKLLSASSNALLLDSLDRHPKLLEQLSVLLSERGMDIPLLVYSAHDNEKMIVAAMKAGAHDFISSQNPGRIVPAMRRELLSAQQRSVQRKQAKLDILAQDVDGWMLQGLDAEPLAQKICAQLVVTLDLRLAWIGGKRTADVMFPVAAAGCTDYLRDVAQVEAARETCPVRRAVAEHQAVTLRVDAAEFMPCREAAEKYDIHSFLALPLLVREDIIGVLVMYSARRDAFDAANVKRYQNLAQRLAINLLGAQEHQQFRLLSAAINKATQAIFITTRAGHIIWFNEALSDISGYSSAEIMDSTPHLFNSGMYPVSYWEEMWQNILRGNLWQGEVQNRRKNNELYSVLQSITPLYNEQREVTHFLYVQQDVSERKMLESKIEYLAYHDALTDLPNRSLFNDRMQQAINQARRDEARFSLLFIDLDGFKEINDNYGHAAGDQLLKHVADRLRACVREGDTVARLGGDEFIVLLRDAGRDAHLGMVADKIIEQIASQYELDAGIANVSASVGISAYPEDGRTAEILLNRADEAMYAAKHAGKNRYEFWRAVVPIEPVDDWQI